LHVNHEYEQRVAGFEYGAGGVYAELLRHKHIYDLGLSPAGIISLDKTDECLMIWPEIELTFINQIEVSFHQASLNGDFKKYPLR
jgi:hypothetical protein